jgi:outer membrane murein-binding lipoprotein Lpp
LPEKRRTPVKKFMLAGVLVAGICLLQGAASAAGTATEPGATTPAQATTQSQTATPDQKATAQDIELMRKDIRSMRKQLVAANLKLTDTEATKFWPVYDQYIAELVKINNTKYQLLQEYFNSYGQLTDEQADSMTTRLLKLDVSVAELRQKYQPMFRAAVPAKVTASFFQLDRRIAMMIDLQLGSQIPLVQK